MKKVILKKDKEKMIVVNRHPWIFSGAIEQFSEDMTSGDIASVYSHDGKFLALAYFQLENSLSGRVISFEKKPIETILREKITQALVLRRTLLPQHTNCFRLIHAEEDELPGLIVDFYNGVLVVQINTLGMEKLRDQIVKALIEILEPTAIYEKSLSFARTQEGLLPYEGWLYGQRIQEVLVIEQGVQFLVSIETGQKTGFFLDQGQMRKGIGTLSKDKKVLNCFSYTGGFSLYALKGGATHVTSVDACAKASDLALRNTHLNAFPIDSHRIVQQDAFAFLEEEDLSSFDLIILDPPAFAKKRQDLEAATKGYKRLVETVFHKCKSGTLVLVCSCSYFLDESTFRKVLFYAASITGREVKILSGHMQSPDHPVSIYHPEGEYLKGFLLWVA